MDTGQFAGQAHESQLWQSLQFFHGQDISPVKFKDKEKMKMYTMNTDRYDIQLAYIVKLNSNFSNKGRQLLTTASQYKVIQSNATQISMQSNATESNTK